MEKQKQVKLSKEAEKKKSSPSNPASPEDIGADKGSKEPSKGRLSGDIPTVQTF